ncbi:ABC transporter substrate-binding protein [Streptomyces sp. RTd22]|uniref:ABC transporter substrate-binding protein n=1 Tax=Streptomyces sp. RTd22 TaxID=1841249 RepID=UPI0007C5A565|nr:ABC transporter substrate-binding protein [Streptomyces sp. RTd22]
MRVQLTAVGLVTVMAAGGLTACGSSSSGDTSGGGNRTLTLGTTTVVSQWDPFKNDWGPFLQPQQAAYDSLVHRNPDGSFAPGLATKWSYADPSTFDMTIRHGVTFSDGTKLDAAAVKANLDHGTSVQGPRTDEIAAISKVTVTAPDQVRIKLSRPDPSLPLVFSAVLGQMASPKALKDPALLKKKPVGAGPYTLDTAATTPGDKYTFVKNPKYWDAKSVKFDKLVFPIIQDSTASLNALRSGQIDGAIGTLDDVPAAKAAGLAVSSSLSYFTALNINDRSGRQVKALGDVRVRRALNYAVDREALQATAGEGQPTTQIFPPGQPGYVKALDKAYPYSPAKAKKLLAQAGYPSGIDLTVTNTAVLFFDRYGQALAQQLKKSGIRIKIHNVSLPQYQAMRLSDKNPLYAWFYNWIGTPIDANRLLRKNGQYNPYRVDNPKLDKLIDKAAAETGARQRATYEEISKEVVDQALFVVTNIGKTYYFYNPKKVKEMNYVPLESLPFVRGLEPAS